MRRFFLSSVSEPMGLLFVVAGRHGFVAGLLCVCTLELAVFTRSFDAEKSAPDGTVRSSLLARSLTQRLGRNSSPTFC